MADDFEATGRSGSRGPRLVQFVAEVVLDDRVDEIKELRDRFESLAEESRREEAPKDRHPDYIDEIGELWGICRFGFRRNLFQHDERPSSEDREWQRFGDAVRKAEAELKKWQQRLRRLGSSTPRTKYVEEYKALAKAFKPVSRGLSSSADRLMEAIAPD